MKYYHMIIARKYHEHEYSKWREYISRKQGSAPRGWVCVAVCGYHEEEIERSPRWR